MGMLEDFELLKKNKFRLLPYGWAKTKMEAHLIAKHIGYPIAMKIISDEISHKTDVGGVKIGIRNDQALSLAYDEIIECAKQATGNGKPIKGIAKKDGFVIFVKGASQGQTVKAKITSMGRSSASAEVVSDTPPTDAAPSEPPEGDVAGDE